VKRLLNTRTIKDKMFHREVLSLISVKHQNIVRFLGYCSFTEEHAILSGGRTIMADIRERLLCFEYIRNGSLEKYLTGTLPHCVVIT
jgi:coatomer subunit beta'